MHQTGIPYPDSPQDGPVTPPAGLSMWLS